MKNTMRCIIGIVALGMMVFSGSQLWDVYSEYAAANELYADVANQFVHTSEAGAGEETELNISIDFDSLFAENEDIVGWIYSKDTPINYPIVQSGDNNYYLHRLLDGSSHIAGSIFMDYRNNPDLTDTNTIIYGHNMKNKTMFGTLQNYKDQAYYDKHPVIYYMTREQTYKVELLTGYVTDARSNTYNIPQTAEEQKDLFKEMKLQSTFEANASFQEFDKLITFSTCSSDYDEARYVVVGRIMEP